MHSAIQLSRHHLELGTCDVKEIVDAQQHNGACQWLPTNTMTQPTVTAVGYITQCATRHRFLRNLNCQGIAAVGPRTEQPCSAGVTATASRSQPDGRHQHWFKVQGTPQRLPGQHSAAKLSTVQVLSNSIADKPQPRHSPASQGLMRVPIGPSTQHTPVSQVRCEGDQNHPPSQPSIPVDLLEELSNGVHTGRQQSNKPQRFILEASPRSQTAVVWGLATAPRAPYNALGPWYSSYILTGADCDLGLISPESIIHQEQTQHSSPTVHPGTDNTGCCAEWGMHNLPYRLGTTFLTLHVSSSNTGCVDSHGTSTAPTTSCRTIKATAARTKPKPQHHP